MKIITLENNRFLYIIDKSIENDRPFISKYKSDILKILIDSYKNIDGCSLYTSARSMYDSVGRYKLIFDNNMKLYAAATYRVFYSGKSNENHKLILIGGLQNDDGKDAVKWIIKSDIVNFKKFYWIEASGVIEHWYEKYGAVKIPSSYIKEILPEKMQKGLTLIENNNFQYNRSIIISGKEVKITKTMFGFNSPETLNKILDGEGINKLSEKCSKLYNSSFPLLEFSYNIILGYYAQLQSVVKQHEKYGHFININENIDEYLYDLIMNCKDILDKNEVHRIRDMFENLYNKVFEIYLSSNVLKLNRYF